MKAHYTIAVVGNPNCGKTTLFNALTGSRQRVGNWPGVTVERKVGRYSFEGKEYRVVDLPGTYSLDVTDEELSLDEKIARDYVHGGEADLIVNIGDASNLERNLYLTSQLLEMKPPLVVALNMMDVAADRGLEIDTETLARKLDRPVVPVVASRGRGIDALKRAIRRAVESPRPASDPPVTYDGALERAIDKLVPRCRSRWLATRLLEGDDLAGRIVGDAVSPEQMEALRDEVGEDVDILLADGRYGFAHRATQASVTKRAATSRTRSDRIDRVVLNRLLGIPIFLAVMYLMFMLTINIGGAFTDFFDIFTGAVAVDGFAAVLRAVGSPEWLTLFLADGIGGGIRVVATFIPVIAFLYLFLSVLEDSGYMARAAFVMDRFMRAIGLPGKSFVPLIVGFGCNVPAIMASRTLDNRRDRILTVMMTPFMSCGARLPVYALFAAAFFPVGGQNAVFGLYLIGIALAVMTGFLMKQTLLRGESSPFVMELPPYHMPTVTGVVTRTWDRTKDFTSRAGKVIVPMVLVLNLMNAVGTDGSFGRENCEGSLLSEVGRGMAPAFSPMGLAEDNWPATVGIFTGVLAKEAVVGTLDSMYTALAETDADVAVERREFDLGQSLSTAFETIPANLADALGTWADPLGMGVGDEQEVAAGTFGAMTARFDGAAGAFAYLLFILLYAPCVAAISAVYRETTAGWTLFVAGWTTGLGYGVATFFYQAATFARHPASSTAWIAALAALMAVVFLLLRRSADNKAAVLSVARQAT